MNAYRSVSTHQPWAPRLGLALIFAASLGAIGLVQGARAQSISVTLLDGAGPALADPDGWTLYTWDGDEPGWSNCYDACAMVWPPYLMDTDPVAPSSFPGTLGLIERLDGTWQVTFDGWPLYYYLGDAQPGDASGEGSMGFDARWYVVPLDDRAAVSGAPPSPETPFFPSSPPPSVSFPPFPPPVLSQQPPAPPTPAPATVPVSIVDFQFRPPTLNIQVGDTVSWTNDGPSIHTATSDRGLWDTRELRRGQSASNTFTAAGTFAYHCLLHPWMQGTITVGGTGVTASPPFQIPGYMPERGIGYPPSGGAGTFPYPIGNPGYAVGGQLSTVSAVAPPGGTLFLTWLASPGAQSYRIYQTTTAQPLNFQIAQTVSQSLGVLATNASVSGLSPGTTYLFQVRAVAASGLEVVAPASASAGPFPFVPGGSLAPTGLTVTANALGSVTLTWAETPGAVAYQVLQATVGTGPFALVASTAGSTETVTLSGLTTGATYQFQVRAVDAAGNLSLPSPTVSVTIGTTLAAPTGVTVVGTTSTTASLSWTPTFGATSYQVLLGLTATGPFTPVATSALTTVAVTGLSPSTTYFFQVKAMDAVGAAGAPSATLSALTTSGLAGPSSLTLVATTATTATLSWGASPGATSFQVLQATSPTGPFTVSAVTNAFVTSATVSGLSPGTTFFFQVRAVDGFGNLSGSSNTIAALTAA